MLVRLQLKIGGYLDYLGRGWYSLILKPIETTSFTVLTYLCSAFIAIGSGDNLLKVAGSQVEDAQKWIFHDV